MVDLQILHSDYHVSHYYLLALLAVDTVLLEVALCFYISMKQDTSCIVRSSVLSIGVYWSLFYCYAACYRTVSSIELSTIMAHITFISWVWTWWFKRNYNQASALFLFTMIHYKFVNSVSSDFMRIDTELSNATFLYANLVKFYGSCVMVNCWWLLSASVVLKEPHSKKINYDY